MCLIFEKNEDAIPKIAKKDILVFKSTDNSLSNNEFESVYLRYIYKKNHLNKTIKIKLEQNTKLEYVIEKAYHSSKNFNTDCYFKALFIIPKGSTYYEGYANSIIPINKGYASSNIVYFAPIKSKFICYLKILQFKLGLYRIKNK